MRRHGHTDMKHMKLGELVEVIGGQIMTRIKADSEEVIETRKVIVPKAINDTGRIDAELLPDEDLKAAPDEKKITHAGDIVMKLNSPYGCAMIDESAEGCIVPSFCAIIRPMDNESIEERIVLPDYLVAFLNSSICKDQLDSLVQGAVLTILSVGKVREILVPIPSEEKQHAISMTYLETQYRISLLEEIQKLEKMKNDALFAELED